MGRSQRNIDIMKQFFSIIFFWIRILNIKVHSFGKKLNNKCI